MDRYFRASAQAFTTHRVDEAHATKSALVIGPSWP